MVIKPRGGAPSDFSQHKMMGRFSVFYNQVGLKKFVHYKSPSPLVVRFGWTMIRFQEQPSDHTWLHRLRLSHRNWVKFVL